MAIIFLLCIIILVWLLIELFFWLSHRKPLTELEITKLMKKRRNKYIKKHFTLRETNTFPNKDFKSSMKPTGKMYYSNIDSLSFPSYVANLLKWKKHVWVVVGCLKDNVVKCFYLNKGNDNMSVSLNIDIYELIEFCKINGYQTIMRFHNHPNNNPNRYYHIVPCKQDEKSANHFSNITLSAGINWLDYVCERGHVLEYFAAFSDSFYPAESSYDYIYNQNCNSENYYKLQRELGIFR